MIWHLSILARSAGRLRNMGDVIGGLERTNEEAASEAEVGRDGEFPVSDTLLRGLGWDREFICWGLRTEPVSGEAEIGKVISGAQIRRWCSETPRVRPRMQ
jgi:hypothetical protein